MERSNGNTCTFSKKMDDFLIQEKKEELESINDQINKAKEAGSQLQTEVIDKTKKVIDLRSEIFLLTKQKQEYLQQLPASDHFENRIEELPQELLTLLKDRKNKMQHLFLALSDSESSLTETQNDIANLFATHSNLITKLNDSNIQLFQSEQRKYISQRKLESFKDQDKELQGIAIRIEKSKIFIEEALSKTIKRIEGAEFNGGGLIDLQNSISNLEIEISMIDEKIKDGLSQMSKFEELIEKDQQIQTEQISLANSLFSWSHEKEDMQTELASLNKGIRANTNQLNLYEESIEQKENRIKVLSQIANKHKNHLDDVEVDQDVSIDDLIKSLNSLSKSNNKMNNSQEEKLRKLIASNSEKEKQIDARNREYQHMVDKYHADMSIVRKKIYSQREYNSNAEYQIVGKIISRKIKLENNKMDKQALQKSRIAIPPYRRNVCGFAPSSTKYNKNRTNFSKRPSEFSTSKNRIPLAQYNYD